MDEFDFIDALADKPIEGAVLLRKLKEASPASDFLRKNAIPIAGAIAGGAVVMGRQYLNSKPGPDGLSRDQKSTGSAHAVMHERAESANSEGRELPFSEDMAHTMTGSFKNLADTMARHPKKSTMLVAPGGLAFGLGLGKMVAKHIK